MGVFNKRLAGMLIGMLAVVLNRKFGLGLTTEDQAVMATLLAAWLVQSGLKAGMVAKAEMAEVKP